ncbi:MAG: hypothetical protein ACXWSC_21555, partial [Bdellovibrionota bacterium]
MFKAPGVEYRYEAMKRRMIFSFVLALLLAVPALAEEATSAPIQVEVGPAYGNIRDFPRNPHAVVHRRAAAGPKSTLPELSKRREVFGKVAGLDSSIKGMDEVDLDLLYVRAESLPQAELTKKYPNIPEEQL